MSQWTVISVFDPTGGGADFAYTVGLTSFGHPELHVWARPNVGHDVGADYMLSTNDRTVLLNRLADDLITGEIAVGSVVEETFDAGLTTVAYTLGEPVHPDTVDAFQVDDDAEVIPVRWELQRPAIAEPAPVDPAAVVELNQLLATAVAAAPADARFGPASGFVASIDAHLAGAQPLDVLDVVRDLARVHRMLAGLVGVTEVASRTVGRVDAHGAAVAAATARAEQLAAGVVDADINEDESTVAAFLTQVLAAAYTAVVVVDALPSVVAAPAVNVVELVGNPAGALDRLARRDEARQWVHAFEELLTTAGYDDHFDVDVTDEEDRAHGSVVDAAFRTRIGSGAMLRLRTDNMDHASAVAAAAAAAVLLADGLIEPDVASAAMAPAQRLFDASAS